MCGRNRLSTAPCPTSDTNSQYLHPDPIQEPRRCVTTLLPTLWWKSPPRLGFWDVLATDQHTIPYLFGVAYINQDTVVNYKSTGIFLTNHYIVDNFNRQLLCSFVKLLAYHRFVGNLCWRTTSLSTNSVDKQQVCRWPMLTNYKPVSDICRQTTSMTSVDELQARRWASVDELQVHQWLLLANYKPVGDLCWQTTSPSVTSVGELQVRRWPLLTNYKSDGGFCWPNTSLLVTPEELLVSWSLCWLDNERATSPAHRKITWHGDHVVEHERATSPAQLE